MHRKTSECTENSALETHLNPAQVAQKFKNFEIQFKNKLHKMTHSFDWNCVECTLNAFCAKKTLKILKFLNIHRIFCKFSLDSNSGFVLVASSIYGYCFHRIEWHDILSQISESFHWFHCAIVLFVMEAIASHHLINSNPYLFHSDCHSSVGSGCLWFFIAVFTASTRIKWN